MPERAAPENADSIAEALSEADARELLERVASLPITTWSYLWDHGAVRHIGPMAQDFHAAFGVGRDDRHIDTADALGVALAAIQALFRLVRDQSAEIVELRARIERLERATDA
jgi:hypothetical protein